jgi:hypothetical protein
LAFAGAESDDEMEMSDEARAWNACCKELDALWVDDDGIFCLPAVRGEASAVERLCAVLAKAFGKEWFAVREAQLLKDAGSEGIKISIKKPSICNNYSTIYLSVR